MQNNFPKIPLFLSLMFLAFSLFTFVFLYKEIDQNIQESEQILTNWQAETNRRDQIKSLTNSVKMVDKERVLLESHFAQSSDIVPFLDTIEKLALEVGAKAEVVSVDISKDNTLLLVEMRASGSFKTLYNFLNLLENSPYELEFSVVDMQKEEGQVVSNKGAKISKWQAVFRIKLLSFVP